MNFRAVLAATALATALFAAGLIIPLLGQIVVLFVPVPFILVAVRHGFREGLAAIAGATVIIALIAGWQAGTVLLVGFGLAAFGVSWGMRKGKSPEYAVLLGGLLPVAAAAVPLLYFIFTAGGNPLAAVEAYLRSSIDEAVKIYTSLGLADMATAVNAMSDVFIHYFVRLLPGIVVATSLVQTACCYGIARAFLLRRPGSGPDLSLQPALASWHAPDAWVWGLIVALGAIAVPHEAVKFAGLNAVILYAIVYTVQGMALVDFLLRKGGLNAPARAVIHAVVLALPSIMFLPPLGVVDIWADFRKVRKPAQQGSS
jgi:uncharacterized protein YybS (DUF2232 family)